ncbi:MAG: CO dehydrogenase/CO-methylating acetyl-CoA synthase complex subunit beta [Nitrososphaerota archaeon]|nr:CO dehydrogenase/CO-methylating acetyl-CoA synthase complex subunit beta [Nitrososphaerota archaeon]
MFADIPVDVGVIYEGERIRKKDLHVELGGPNVPYKFELVKAREMGQIEDGKIQIIGPDLKDLPEGGSYPFGIFIEVAGKQVEESLEGVIERRIHEYANYIEGLMHLNQRYDIWIRISKKSFQKGFNSFVYFGRVLERLYKSELPFIEAIQITFITDPEKVKEMYQFALETYNARDARARGLKDEEVDCFYGCLLCQSFAPTHVCVITPQRYSNCGSISWFDGRASVNVDPKGSIYRIEKGECLDPIKGEYSGVNEAVQKKSLGAIKKVQLYTAFGNPHTSCGCFEAAAFYIPEVDGLGIVDRGFKGVTVNGLPFSTIADSTAGGRQVDGFHGVSIEYMRSPKFLQADGGWSRIVWLPSALKERVKDFIPKDLIDKIATEKDVSNVEELKAFLEKKAHPVVQRWKKVEAPPVLEVKEKEEVKEVRGEGVSEAVLHIPSAVTGGFELTLEGVKIHAKRLIIRRKAQDEKGGE